MFQTPNWQCVHTLHGHSSSVTSVVITPDGQTIVSGSSDSTIKLWNLNTGEEIHTLAGHSQGVTSITLSPDGQTLASYSKDKTIKLWNLRNRQQIYTISGHSEEITSVVISPDGKTLASADYTTIKVWNLSNGEEIRTLKWQVKVYYGFYLAFSRDGQILVTSSGDDYVSLSAVAFNLTIGEEIWAKNWKDGMDSVYSMGVSPDGESLATFHISNSTIKLWNIYTGTEISTVAKNSTGYNCLVFSPDGKIIATGGCECESEDDSSEPGTIELWNLDTTEKICPLLGHSSEVYSVTFSPDGKTLVSGSDDSTVKIWQRDL